MKGQKVSLIFGTYLVRLNISSKNNDFGFNSHGKNEHFKIFPT